MRIEPEPLDGCYRELDTLWRNARTIDAGLPPLRVDWLAFQRLEAADALLVVTARDDEQGGVLLGFAMYLIVPHMHHVGKIIAACDSLAVAVGERGQRIASRLMETAEPILRARGASYVTHQFRVCYDVQPLFPKLGYTLIEQSYMKELH